MFALGPAGRAHIRQRERHHLPPGAGVLARCKDAHSGIHPAPPKLTAGRARAPPVPAKDCGGEGQVQQLHAVLVPALPAQPLRRGGGGGARALRSPARPRPPAAAERGQARRSTGCRAGAARAAGATATAATAGRCGRAVGPSAARRRAATCLSRLERDHRGWPHALATAPQKRGLEATGILAGVSKAAGFGSVSALLVTNPNAKRPSSAPAGAPDAQVAARPPLARSRPTQGTP